MRFPIVLLLGCMLIACNRPAAEAPGADAASPAAATSPSATVATPASDTATCAFCAEPATVRTCEVATGVTTVLHWKITDPTVARVGLFVVDDAGKDMPFAEQPPVGSLGTGPWLKPGLTFKLKDPDGKVLETLVIAGTNC